MRKHVRPFDEATLSELNFAEIEVLQAERDRHPSFFPPKLLHVVQHPDLHDEDTWRGCTRPFRFQVHLSLSMPLIK